ncbi:MAG: RHS repeat-associated core domain-containing protein [Chitinophagales bacterium]
MLASKTNTLDSIQTPFGMVMPGRNWTATTAEGYGFGFNGKLKDDDISGNGNIYDYGFRIYNPRIGKFLSLDPLSNSFPWYTPYQFSGNKPIMCLDMDGMEEIYFDDQLVTRFDEYSALEVLSATEVAGGYLQQFQNVDLNKTTNWVIVLDETLLFGGAGVTFTIPADILYINYYTYQQGIYVGNEVYKTTAINEIAKYVGNDITLAQKILESKAAKASIGLTPNTTKNLQVTVIGIKTEEGTTYDSNDETGFFDSQGNKKTNLWTLSLVIGHEFIAHVAYLVIDGYVNNEDAEHNRFESDNKENPENLHHDNDSESTPMDVLPSIVGSKNSDGAKLYYQTKEQIDKRKKN